MKRVLCLALLVFTACHAKTGTSVTIRLGALHAHAALANVRIDRIELRVTAPDMDPVIIAIDPAALSFSLDLDAGLQRRFEVEAYQADTAGAQTPIYWGEAVVDLPPRTSIDVVIPTFPAGSVTALVQTNDGTPVPDGLRVSFDAPAPINGRPEHLEAVLSAGSIQRTLPTGAYQVSAALDVAGEIYALRPPRAVQIDQGILVDLGVLYLVPAGAISASAQPAGLPVAGLGSTPGLYPAAATMLRSPGYVLQIGALTTIEGSTLSSPTYRLQSAAQTLQRSAP